ncbi:hypothetical protein FQN49_006973 [Arthroderma sp. PD_2]|nr:hypothetical protein FQN49_006973 [Arthroderma sp. PD_2]
MDLSRFEPTASARATEHSSVISSVFNFLLLLAIPLAYIPQYIQIRNRQSTYGISFGFLVIRAISTTANIANLLVLGPIFHVVVLCREQYSGGRCFVEMVSHWQFVTDWICSQLLLFLSLRYYKASTANGPLQPAIASSVEVPLSNERYESQHYSPTVIRTAISSVILSYIIILGPSVFYMINPLIPSPGYYILLQTWSFITIGIASILTLVAFLPQILHTRTLKQFGNLSTLTLVLQTIIYFLLALSLFLRFESDYPHFFSRYLLITNGAVNYTITGVEELILLSLGLYYAYAKREDANRPAEEHEHRDDVEEEATERDPLLPREEEGTA